MVAAKCGKLLSVFKRYKYRWSRFALETCYKAFIRPIVEYGNLVYDSCTEGLNKQIEALQAEAARLVTGTKKGTSTSSIIKELGWESLQSRRKNAKLVKMYEIIYDKAPFYLTELVQKFQLQTSHFTRSHARLNLTIPKCKTNIFRKSFIVSGIVDWNQLDVNIKTASNKLIFKRSLSTLNKTDPIPFPHNSSRSNQVWFAQLRADFSNLNGHLYSKGCIETSSCTCGYFCEDTAHYLLHCPLYTIPRQILLHRLSFVNANQVLTASLLLYGSTLLSLEENLSIFDYVCEFIKQSGRFHL